MKACLEASARLRRRLEAMERVPRSYKPRVDGCQDRVASAIGLLTEVALLGFERLGRYIEEIGRSGDVVTDVRALSLAFVTFALDHPVHFRLTFRNDLMNRKDPRYPEMSGKPGCGSVLQLRQIRCGFHRFEDAADMLCGMSTLHWLAHLLIWCWKRKLPIYFGTRLPGTS